MIRRQGRLDPTPTPRPRKKRKLLSCNECNRRKQRCNRERPCYQCKERATECSYSSMPSPPSSSTFDPVKTIKHGGRIASPHNETCPSGSSSHYASPTSLQPHEGTIDEHTIRIGPSSSFTQMLSTSSASAILEQAASMSVDQSIDDALAMLGALENGSGPAPLPSASLLACLYSATDTRRLVDSYIQHVRSIHYPVPVGMLCRSLERAIKAKVRGTVCVGDLEPLAVVFGSLSLASPEVIEKITQRRDGPQRFHHALMRCLRIRDTLGGPTAATCLGWHLAGRYLLIDGGVAKSWRAASTAAQIAMCVGLHRDVDDWRIEDDTVEERRLLWGLIRYDERTFSSMTELPSCVDDRCCTTLSPPFSTTLSADVASFVQWRSELASLIGKVSKLLRRARSNATTTTSARAASNGGAVDLEQVLLLDEEITHFQHTLPSADLSTNFSTSIRFMIHTHTLQTRINLLRPFILLDLPAHASLLVRHRRKICRLSCTEAACQDLEMREHLVATEKDMLFYDSLPVPMQNPFRSVRWLASLIICGIYCLTYHWDQSEIEVGAASQRQQHQRTLLSKARGHLDRFLSLADGVRGVERNLAQQKEIIRAFIQQAQQLEQQQQQQQQQQDSSSSPFFPFSNRDGDATATARGSKEGDGTSTTGMERVDATSQRLPQASQPVMPALGDQNLQDLLDAWFRAGAMDSTHAAFTHLGQQRQQQLHDLPQTHHNPAGFQANAASLSTSRAPESSLAWDDAAFWESFTALMVER